MAPVLICIMLNQWQQWGEKRESRERIVMAWQEGKIISLAEGGIMFSTTSLASI
jgi:hypothetical protein